MELGIFSKTYSGDLESVFASMRQDGLTSTQFNLTSAGLETMPLTYDPNVITKIKTTAEHYGIHLAALSGTFNMIDPDLNAREDGIQRFRVLCEIAQLLDIKVVSLCTGSKNPKSKWEWDDRNLSPEAWQDLIETTHRLIPMAERYDLILGVETEASNIVNTPQKARLLLDTINNDHLRIIMDGANLFLPHQVNQMKPILKEAFGLLGKDICLAHAKDLGASDSLSFTAAGKGILDFDTYLDLMRKAHYDGPLILHGLSPQQVSASVAFLKGKL